MEFRQLRTFVQVVELKSITAAAERLHIAQPALSRQIQALEEELGVPLLLRHGRGVVPTEDGIALANRARQILDGIDDMVSEIGSKDSALRGSVTLGLPPTVAEVLATPLIEQSMTRHPEVRLRIVSGFSGHVQDWLQRGTIDIGITYEGHKVATVKSQPLLLEQLFLIESAEGNPVPDGTPIMRREALERDLILPSPEHGLRRLVNSIAAKDNQDLKVVLEVDILPTLLAFVERRLGSTILPLVSVFREVRAGQLIARPIVKKSVSRTLVMWTPLNRPTSRLTQHFTNMMVADIHAFVRAGKWPGTTL